MRYRPRKHRPVWAVNISYISERSLETGQIEIKHWKKCAPGYVFDYEPAHGIDVLNEIRPPWTTEQRAEWWAKLERHADELRQRAGEPLTSTEHPHG